MKARREQIIHPWSAEQTSAPVERQYRWGAPGSRAWRTHWRTKQREYSRASRERHPGRHLEHVKRYQKRYPERVKASCRRYYWSHHEQRLLEVAIYRSDHREELNAKARERDTALRESMPGYKPLAQRSVEKLALGEQVVALREVGMKWADVSQAVGRPMSTCVHAYDAAKARQPVVRDQRAFEQQVVKMRDAGMSFYAIAKKLDKAISGCIKAYRRVKERGFHQPTEEHTKPTYLTGTAFYRDKKRQQESESAA